MIINGYLAVVQLPSRCLGLPCFSCGPPEGPTNRALHLLPLFGFLVTWCVPIASLLCFESVVAFLMPKTVVYIKVAQQTTVFSVGAPENTMSYESMFSSLFISLCLP